MSTLWKFILASITTIGASALAFGADISAESLEKSAAILAAGIAVGVAAGGSGAGIGLCAKGLVDGIARNPSLRTPLLTNTILGIALVETCVIYGIVMALLLLYAI